MRPLPIPAWVRGMNVKPGTFAREGGQVFRVLRCHECRQQFRSPLRPGRYPRFCGPDCRAYSEGL